MRYTLPLLAGLAALPSGTLSMATDMTLSWPKPHYENTTDYDPTIGRTNMDPSFPCRDIEPPASVERVPWPIGGARIRLKRTSNLWNRTKDVDTRKVGVWFMDYSFGHEYWDPEDFEIGGWCTKRTAIVDWVVNDVRRSGTNADGKMFDKSEMEGVNATLGFYITHELGGNFTSHTQCVYVQFTSGASAGPCKKASTKPSDAEDDITYIYPDVYYPPEPAPAYFFNVTGMVAGLVVGAVFLAVIGVCCCRSRRKGRAARAARQNLPRADDIELQYPKPPTNPDDEQLPAYSGPPPRYNTGIGPVAAGAAPAPVAPAPAATTTTATGGAGN